MAFKDVFRHAAKHGLIRADACERWLEYRENRNDTAHDYGAGFAEATLKLLPRFVDARRLADVIAGWRCTTGHACRRAFTPRSNAGTWCWSAESQAGERNVQASACSLCGLSSGPNASQVPLKKMRFSGGSLAKVSLLGRR